MNSIKRPSALTPSTLLVLGVLALLAGVYFGAPALDSAARAVAFLLVGVMVIILLMREFTERRRMEAAADTAHTLNEELDERVTQRTRQLEAANRKLAAEIADRERATEQLRLLAAHLQSAREEERITIAREIHDEIGTLMTAIKMDLAYLSKEITGGTPKSPETLREEISATTKLVDNAIRTVHQIALELRPAVLDHLGLRSALEWQVREFQARTKIESEFVSTVDHLQLDPERSTAVFRILQEALTNVARHAHATHVEVTLQEQDRQLMLQVHDNGRGISQEQVSGTRQFGLLGMRERAHIFGGDVLVQGAPGQGTTVAVRIPV
ncbi:MAG: sensor histidine kinase [Chloroflexi bacterium]|nr:sensor histidine kinase [Chloroflexota bacterium]